ncbi:hypothetical protein F2P81_012868 [Scophthalmus maximus]|uniref:Uncharacterized protein n=1 Tax=Scophthalmus maximus TaxID=52904 RepID=A0A6A4ST86_SCOMX|nr:hypothetical protein F2P81_012868 [Scophthalmus maximus]
MLEQRSNVNTPRSEWWFATELTKLLPCATSRQYALRCFCQCPHFHLLKDNEFIKQKQYMLVGCDDSSQAAVQPKAPLLQILRVAGAQEEVFTLKEVMHYLGQYIMGKQLYDKQRQHIVHCQDDPLGELLEVDSFSVKNPSPVYEMLKKYLVVLGCSDAAENLSVGRECVEGGVEDRGQVKPKPGAQRKQRPAAFLASLHTTLTPSQRRPREPDDDSLEGLPRSACKRAKLDVTLDDWDLSGLPWWFLGNLRSNYSRRSNGSTDIHTNQEEDTAIVSDTTDDLWFLTEGESEQVSVEMTEAALEEGSAGEGEALPEDDDGGGGREEKADREEEPDEDSQCLSDDTDTEISTQDAWQCTECRKYNTPLQRYCVRCWALRKNWYKDVPRLAHSLSVPDIPACSSLTTHDEEDDSDTGIDVPDCSRTVSDPVILPSHSTADRPLPTMAIGKGKGPSGFRKNELRSEGESQENLGMEVEDVRLLLEPCKLCRVRARNGNILHGGFVFLAVVTCYFSTVLCVWKSPVHRLKSIRLCSGCVKVELEHIAMHYMCVSIVQAHGSSPYHPVQCSPSEVQLQSMRVPQLILLAQNNGGLVYELLRCWKPKLLFLSCQTLAMNTKTRDYSAIKAPVSSSTGWATELLFPPDFESFLQASGAL